MTFHEMVDLLRWDWRVNPGFSWDRQRARLRGAVGDVERPPGAPLAVLILADHDQFARELIPSISKAVSPLVATVTFPCGSDSSVSRSKGMSG